MTATTASPARPKLAVRRALPLSALTALTAVAAVTSLALAALPAPGAGAPSSGGGALIPVRYGEFPPQASNLAVYLGIEKGFFAEEGLDVRLTQLSGPPTVAAATAGEIDLGTVGSPALVGIAAGVPIRIVASPAYTPNPFTLVGRTGIGSVAQLRGKKLGVGSAGAGGRQAARIILAAHGVPPDQVVLLPTSGGEIGYAALQAGAIDAGIFGEPWATKLELDGAGRRLAAAADHFGRYQHSVIFATQRFIAERPDAIRRFLRAYRRSVRWAKTHRPELLAYGVAKTGVEERVLRAVLDRMVPTWSEDGAVDVEGLEHALAILKEVGDVDRAASLTAREAVDLRFLRD